MAARKRTRAQIEAEKRRESTRKGGVISTRLTEAEKAAWDAAIGDIPSGTYLGELVRKHLKISRRPSKTKKT